MTATATAAKPTTYPIARARFVRFCSRIEGVLHTRSIAIVPQDTLWHPSDVLARNTLLKSS